MAYSDLTLAQQQAIQTVLTPILRPSVGELRRVVQLWQEVLALYDDPKSEFRAALNALTASDMLPNTSGLAGAGEISKGELTNPTTGLLADMRTVVTTWEDSTRLSLCVRVGGINAE